MSFWCNKFHQNSNKNIERIFALKFFVASWVLLRDLVSNINDQKAHRKLQGNKGNYENFRAEILTIFLLLFWSKRWHFKITRPLKISKNCHFDHHPQPLKCLRNIWVVPNRANPQNLPDSLTLYIMITFRDSLNALLNRPSLAGGVLQTPLTLDKSTFSDTDDLTRKNRASRKR